MRDPQDDFPSKYEVEVLKVMKFTVIVDAYDMKDAEERAIVEASKLKEDEAWDSYYETGSIEFYEPKPDLD